jgi:hypothetical protein
MCVISLRASSGDEHKSLSSHVQINLSVSDEISGNGTFSGPIRSCGPVALVPIPIRVLNLMSKLGIRFRESPNSRPRRAFSAGQKQYNLNLSDFPSICYRGFLCSVGRTAPATWKHIEPSRCIVPIGFRHSKSSFLSGCRICRFRKRSSDSVRSVRWFTVAMATKAVKFPLKSAKSRDGVIHYLTEKQAEMFTAKELSQ